jgi:hypothetical protein
MLPILGASTETIDRPIGRGFLSGELKKPEDLAEDDRLVHHDGPILSHAYASCA